MPGSVPHTSTYALTNATLPYLVDVASLGAAGAVRASAPLAHGLNTHHGLLTCEPAAGALSLPFTAPLDAVGS